MDKELRTRNKLFLIGIIVVAFVLRFYRLNEYPALNADEAAIGYNAYSLIQTGRDEHGNTWPIHFQSFNDYKPGLYFYLVLPFVYLLRLNEWAVRIPGAFLGVATVYMVYLFVLELFAKQKNQSPITLSKGRLAFGQNYQSLASISAALLAISPWHIHFSRGGWEVNVATFFIVLGLYLFLKGINKLPILVLSTLSFVLSLYSYHASRIIVPLLGLGLLIIYWEKARGNLRNYLLAGLVGLVVLLPLMKDLTGPAGLSRATGVGLFADPGPLARINEQRGEHGDFRSFSAIILHNKAVNYSLAFLENWADHFHGEFLFLSGDVIQRNKVPETGQLYLFDILFLVVGAIGVIRVLGGKSEDKKGWLLVLWWLIVAPAAAALTFQSPHALRAQNMVIPLIIISAYGLSSLVKWSKEITNNKKLLTTYYLLLTVIIAWNFTRYLHMYWVHMAKEYPFSSQYGVKELVEYVNENQDKYQRIIVTDRYDQPYILFLFYLKYPPEKFQNEQVLTPRDKFGFSTVRNIDKFDFKSIDWDIDQPIYPNSLIIGTDEEIPNEANIVKEIYGSNGYKYFDIVAN